MANTTEARRLADDLLDDADQGQAHIPSLRKSASMLRALADENERMREALSGLVLNEGLEPYMYLDKGIGTATAAGKRWIAAREALK